MKKAVSFLFALTLLAAPQLLADQCFRVIDVECSDEIPAANRCNDSNNCNFEHIGGGVHAWVCKQTVPETIPYEMTINHLVPVGTGLKNFDYNSSAKCAYQEHCAQLCNFVEFEGQISRWCVSGGAFVGEVGDEYSWADNGEPCP